MSYATVYIDRAQDKHTGEIVALKKIRMKTEKTGVSSYSQKIEAAQSITSKDF